MLFRPTLATSCQLRATGLWRGEKNKENDIKKESRTLLFELNIQQMPPSICFSSQCVTDVRIKADFSAELDQLCIFLNLVTIRSMPGVLKQHSTGWVLISLSSPLSWYLSSFSASFCIASHTHDGLTLTRTFPSFLPYVYCHVARMWWHPNVCSLQTLSLHWQALWGFLKADCEVRPRWALCPGPMTPSSPLLRPGLGHEGVWSMHLWSEGSSECWQALWIGYC